MAREQQNLRGRGRFQGRGAAQRSNGGGRKSQYTRSRTSSPVVAQQKAIQFAPNMQGKIVGRIGKNKKRYPKTNPEECYLKIDTEGTG
ncbi:MAG: hypothetical protein ACP5F1_06955 [Thermoplasmata archaeon]